MSGAIPLLPSYALMVGTGMTSTANQLAFCMDSFCCEEMVSVQSKAYSSHILPNCSVTAHDQPLFKWDFNVTSWVPGCITVTVRQLVLLPGWPVSKSSFCFSF